MGGGRGSDGPCCDPLGPEPGRTAEGRRVGTATKTRGAGDPDEVGQEEERTTRGVRKDGRGGGGGRGPTLLVRGTEEGRISADGCFPCLQYWGPGTEDSWPKMD